MDLDSLINANYCDCGCGKIVAEPNQVHSLCLVCPYPGCVYFGGEGCQTHYHLLCIACHKNTKHKNNDLCFPCLFGQKRNNPGIFCDTPDCVNLTYGEFCESCCLEKIRRNNEKIVADQLKAQEKTIKEYSCKECGDIFSKKHSKQKYCMDCSIKYNLSKENKCGIPTCGSVKMDGNDFCESHVNYHSKAKGEDPNRYCLVDGCLYLRKYCKNHPQVNTTTTTTTSPESKTCMLPRCSSKVGEHHQLCDSHAGFHAQEKVNKPDKYCLFDGCLILRKYCKEHKQVNPKSANPEKKPKKRKTGKRTTKEQ